MKQVRSLPIAFVVLLLLVPFINAASRASFCKCMCKSNSTIIPLDTVAPASSRPQDSDAETGRRSKSCNDCNRQFCLDYNIPALNDCLPENKGKEEDIITQCFQRDSAKDQAIVYIFILLTVGLLAYAAVKPWLGQRGENLPSGRAAAYVPLGNAPG